MTGWRAVFDFAVVGAGLHYVVGAAAITHPVRAWMVAWGERAGRWVPGKLVELVECPACFGFWYGLVASAAGMAPWSATARGALASALAGAVLVAALHGWMRRGLEPGGGAPDGA